MARIVVVGASQGGVRALNALIGALPSEFVPPILIVQHIGASRSMLPSILNDIDGDKAAFGQDGEPVCDHRIYVAPPDHHMLLNDGHLELTRGPRENWARPAVDPLFRTAAYYYGADAIGVILSGRLNDGTAGLYEIKRQGGVAIVQTPSEAEAGDMPRSALENVAIDYCVPIAEIPRLLSKLTKESDKQRSLRRGERMMKQEKDEKPTAQTCPDCGGAMRQENLGTLTHFRCHIGHAMTAEVLAAAQLTKLEYDICAIQRTLNERAALCRELSEKHRANGNSRAAETWGRAAEEAQRREEISRQLTRTQWSHPETVLETAE